jgi:hypothetical protein
VAGLSRARGSSASMMRHSATVLTLLVLPALHMRFGAGGIVNLACTETNFGNFGAPTLLPA